MDQKRMPQFDTKIVVFGVVVLTTALFAGCSTSNEHSEAESTIPDSTIAIATIVPAATPMRETVKPDPPEPSTVPEFSPTQAAKSSLVEPTVTVLPSSTPQAEAARPDSPDPTVTPTRIATGVATEIPVEPTTLAPATPTVVPTPTAQPTATDTPTPVPTVVSITGPPNSNWNWQLTGQLDMSVNADVWDVDMFETEPETIAELQQDGRYVICYFSAGSIEDWRPDIGVINQAAIGLPLDGWPGEKWLDVRDESTLQLVESRMALAQEKGCNAVEPDNVDGFSNATGFPLTASDQIQFNSAFAQLAHDRGLAVGLKNSFDIAHALAEKFDFAVTEECHTYDECELLSPFLDLNKPVFNAEYPGSEASGLSNKRVDCEEANRLGIHTLFLPLDLDGSWRVTCD